MAGVLVAVAFGVLAGLTPAVAGADEIAQQIADPSYFNPTADPGTWNQLIGSQAGTVRLAVANVLNGPDYAVASDWASVIQRAHAAGIDVLGYVDTGFFGTTDPARTTRLGSTAAADWLAQEEQDVDAWYRLYGPDIDGIFFDDAQNNCTWASLYADVYAYVKKHHPGALVVENPGTAVPQCFEDTADVIVTFEGSYADYTASSPTTDPNAYVPLTWTSADPHKFWHIIYGASTQAEMESAVALSKSRGAGYVYVTDGELPNPYDTLPPAAYWSDEQTQIAPGSSYAKTAPSVPTGLTTSSTTGTTIALDWTASSSPSAPLAGYDIYENGDYLVSVPGDTTSFSATGLDPSTSYTFTISARDEAGNSSAQSAVLAASTTAPGSTAPTAPSDLTVLTGTYASTTLQWGASTDADVTDSVVAYDVYEDGNLVLTLPSAMTEVTIGELAPGSANTFTVDAEDQTGNHSTASNQVTATTPSLPDGQQIGGSMSGTSGSQITFSADFYVPFGFHHVFIATGDTQCWQTGSSPSFCADYMIENGTLDKYAGSGTDFTWSPVETVTPTISGYGWSWTIQASAIGSPAEIETAFNGDGYAPDTYTTPSTMFVPGYTSPTLHRELVDGINPSEAACDVCASGPTDTPTGEFSQRDSDLAVAGRGLSLDLVRGYSSLTASTDGPFGYGWSGSYDMSVAPDPVLGKTVMDVTQENGAVVQFAQQADGSWAPASRVFATLVQNGNGGWTFTRKKRTAFAFDSSGRLISESDLDGNATTLAYDSSGHLSTVTDPAGRTLAFTWNGSHVTQVRDSGGRTASYQYDANDNLVQVTAVDGGVTKYGYDVNHLMTSIADPDGGTTTIVYDSTGRLASETDPLGNITSWSYDIDPSSLSGSSSRTDPAGVVTQDTFTDGNLTARTAAYGTPQAATTRYTYDPTTNGVASMTDPDGHTTTYTYDSDGDRTSQTDPLGNQTSWTYNSYDEVTSEAQPATYGGQTVTTTYIYDEPQYSSGGAGNLTTVSTPILSSTGASEGTQITHFAHGDPSHPDDVTAMIDPDGNTWTYAYDLAGDRVSETAPATSDNSDGSGSGQNITRWAYNAQTGLVTARMTGRYTLTHPNDTTCTPPAAGCTTYTYDNAGRLLTKTDGAGNTTTTGYDGDGNVIYTIDGAGNKTIYSYDADELVQITEPSGTTTKTDYTPDGRVKDQIGGDGGTTSYTYDALGDRASVTDPDGHTTSYQYDGAGNLLVRGDPGVSGCTPISTTDGCTTYSYNADNAQTAIHYNDPNTHDVSFGYDADGRRIQMTDGTGTSTWVYDSLGDVTQTTDGAGATTSYGYDAARNVISITYPGSVGTVNRTYDPAGRISSITDWSGNTTTFKYDADGDLAGDTEPTTWGAPVTDAYSHDAAGNSSAITVSRANQLASLGYQRDADNRVTQVSSGGALSDSHNYTYTPDGELASVDGESYTYDGARQPTQLPGGTKQTYDPAGELTSVNAGYATTSFTNDAKGERTSGGLTVPGYLPNSYSYNQARELTTAKTSPAATPSYENEVLADSPSGFWELGESSGTTAQDSSGNNAPGTYQGGVTLGQPGALAGDPSTSAQFDGTSGAVKVNTPNLPTSHGSDVTVEFWMYWDGSSYSAMPFGWSGYGLWLAGGPNGSFGFNTGNGDLYGISASGLANRWVHVVAIFHNGDATRSQLYIDGQEQTLSQQFGATGDATVGAAAQISGFPGGSSYFLFDGRIQDVAIYPNALGQDRISAHYQAGTASGYANSTAYDYDGLGGLTSKTVNGTSRQYTWDTTIDSRGLLLTDGTASYLYGPDDLPLERIDGSGDILWYHHDQQGSTRLLTDSAGHIVGTATYDSEGQATATTGVTTPLGYDGRYTDRATGFIYLSGGYFDPVTANFIAAAPAGGVAVTSHVVAQDNPIDAAGDASDDN